jgi:hypothetical protein
VVELANTNGLKLFVRKDLQVRILPPLPTPFGFDVVAVGNSCDRSFSRRGSAASWSSTRSSSFADASSPMDGCRHRRIVARRNDPAYSFKKHFGGHPLGFGRADNL